MRMGHEERSKIKRRAPDGFSGMTSTSSTSAHYCMLQPHVSSPEEIIWVHRPPPLCLSQDDINPVVNAGRWVLGSWVLVSFLASSFLRLLSEHRPPFLHFPDYSHFLNGNPDRHLTIIHGDK